MLLGGVAESSARNETYLYPYAVALAIHGAIIASAHVHLDFSGGRVSRLKLYSVFSAVLKSWSLIFLPLLLLTGFSSTNLINYLLAPLWILLATILFGATTKAGPEFRSSPQRWLKQTAFAGLGSVLALLSTL